MADWLDKVVAPVLGAATGVFSAALGLKSRLHAIEQQVEALQKRVAHIEQEVRQFHNSSADFAKDAALSTFIQEQQRQWQHVQRTLGQIEGMLDAVTTMTASMRK